MTKNEFLEKMDSYGIQLSIISVYIDKEVGVAFSLGAYCNEDEWILYSVNERNEIFESFRGDEADVFERLFRMVFVRLDELNYVTNSITKEVIKTDRQKVISFLRNKYNMEQWELDETWKYLLKDFHVLNEVKYYALNGKFVPDSDCYNVEGYSAEKLNQITYLEVIGAFNYLIYMKNNPKKALADLKKGLPQK